MLWETESHSFKILPEKIFNTHDPVELLKDTGRIGSKGNLASPDVYSSWPPSGQKLMSNKFEVPFFREKLHLQYSLLATKIQTEPPGLLTKIVSEHNFE